jgi:hypothetical protein
VKTGIINIMKNLSLSILTLAIVIAGGYAVYRHQKVEVTSSAPISVPGRVADLGPSSSIDAAFYSPNYKQTSKDPLYKNEQTVTYQYPSSPCGTLMTQFSGVGSVRVGRGPVYALASDKCKTINSSYIPNDFSFRTYACENVSINGSIQGQATFGFQCAPVNENTRCSQARINGEIPQADWNCSGI